MSFIPPLFRSNSTIANFFSVRDRFLIVWMSKSTACRALSPLYTVETVTQKLSLEAHFPAKTPCNGKDLRILLSYRLLKSA